MLMLTSKKQNILNKVKIAAGITGEVDIASLNPIAALLPKFEQFLSGDATAIASKVNNITFGNNAVTKDTLLNVIDEVELYKIVTGQAVNNLLNASVHNKINSFFEEISDVVNLMVPNKAFIAASFLLALAESKK